MSVTKCVQLLPGTLRRWRVSLLLASLISLSVVTYLTTMENRKPVSASGSAPLRQPQTVDLWNQRTYRDLGAQQPPWKEGDQVSARRERSWQDPPPPPPRRDVAIPLRRVVHFDLKGAPPKMTYLMSLLPIIRRLGGTDLLVEWEDMFPFWGALRPAAARNHYSRVEVRQLLSEARRHGLHVIPLVQTFGHMEPFLKLEPFAPLREVPAQPAALCPSKNQSMQLVQLIIDQVMELHKGTQFLHIGCDEVYHMGMCDLCQRQMRDDLYLDHVVRVAQYARRQHGVTPLIWDDMMRHIPVDVLQRSKVGQLVEPMVWVYAEDVYRFVGPHVYNNFAQVFSHVWGASAYKGAFGETLIAPPLQRHLDNTRNWLTVMQNEGRGFSEGFRGLVLTGWQRYDHMAVLCEILPVSVPSLALNLLTASHGFFNASLHEPLYNALGCSSQEGRSDINLASDPYGFLTFSRCIFPGSEFFRYVSQLVAMLARTEETFKSAQKGWLTEYNIERNYTNPFRVDEILDAFYGIEYSLKDAVTSARDSLHDVVDRYTVAEWVEQKVLPWLRRLETLRRQGEALKRRSVWKRRPLPMLQELASYGLNVTEMRSTAVSRRRRTRADGATRGQSGSVKV